MSLFFHNTFPWIVFSCFSEFIAVTTNAVYGDQSAESKWYIVHLGFAELQEKRIYSRKLTTKSNITNWELLTAAVVAGILLHCDLPGVLCAIVSACLLWVENNSMNRLKQKESVVLMILSGLCLFLNKFFDGRNSKLDIKMHQLPKTTVHFYVSEEWLGIPGIICAHAKMFCSL